MPLTAAPMLLSVPLTALHWDKGSENTLYEFSEQLRVDHSHTCRFSEVSVVGRERKGKEGKMRGREGRRRREKERKKKALREKGGKKGKQVIPPGIEPGTLSV